MSADKKLTLYTAKRCPFAHRTEIILNEVGAKFERVEIDLDNKPEWYKDVNPDLKVPALILDGTKLAESFVIVQLISDLYPEQGLLPSDPVQRAQIRFAVELFGSKIPSHWYQYLSKFNDLEARQAYIDNINAGFRRFNDLLLEQAPSGPYFLGSQYSLADIAIAPFILRIEKFNRLYLDGLKFEAVEQLPRLKQFLEGITQRPSAQATVLSDEKFIAWLDRFNIPRP
ncbi:hypothetical protein DFQ28_002098 [Apophysomyces sp. BC1034]|nr:hypothetical protein DFQ30_010327 [Apophysomyces sp. BC1015]KAG0181281.1 hypothetical protein DFQ29_008808 [Apophysomyces sp. BC1021]KAG0193989.1 hypothetical protein DFQ28_002098 [Apophysomyces sp. BC1034]